MIASTLAFVLFGFAGVLLAVGCFPFLRLVFWRSKSQKVRFARQIVQRAFASFVALMRALGLLTYEVSGQERLNRSGMLILANHPSLIDVVFLIALVPNANCVIKRGVRRNPFMRGVVLASNYICNDSGAQLIDDCVQSLHEGNNLIIFPEGTRTPITGMPKLLRGAANIAVRGTRDITPVVIHTNSTSLRKGVPWWYMPQRMQYEFDIREDIAILPYLQNPGEEALATRRLTEFLQHYFFVEGTRPCSSSKKN
jgi:1-acyl-sn-glycerol-3-phosphate acyltransferase